MFVVQLIELIYIMNEVFEILNVISFSFVLLLIRFFIGIHSGHLFGEEIMIYHGRYAQAKTDIIFIFAHTISMCTHIYLSLSTCHEGRRYYISKCLK